MQIVKTKQAIALMTDEYYNEWIDFYCRIYEAMPATLKFDGGRRLRSMTSELWMKQFEFVMPLDSEVEALYLICSLVEDGLWTFGNFWTVRDMRKLLEQVV